ncbi:DUF6708 domain-containing protein [Halomonas sp. V046]|uniref:DUF6708 domain-containing protein n=1 Tax=Halomonas sp. V046 TaxID=3459611 RepID=UPI004044394A
MDYTGLGRFSSYKVNRCLKEDEKKGRLDQGRCASSHPLNWMSVIRINSTYLDLVDRWYVWKGFSVWLGGMVLLISSGLAIGIFLAALQRNETAGWFFAGVIIALCLFFFLLSVCTIRLDAFRYTHYPIRLNRKSRRVYAFRPDGTVIHACWDDLFICSVSSESSMALEVNDIRAHVLADDGVTVVDTFTLGYPHLGDKDGLLNLWEFIRAYMEAGDGVKEGYRNVELCLPVYENREGMAFGIFSSFSVAAKWPFIGQLLFSWLLSLNVLGRWFAMYTSKVPRWPEEIEAACQIDPDDPYEKDWRDNGKYDFREFGWPLICFFVGLGVLGVGLTFLARELLA